VPPREVLEQPGEMGEAPVVSKQTMVCGEGFGEGARRLKAGRLELRVRGTEPCRTSRKIGSTRHEVRPRSVARMWPIVDLPAPFGPTRTDELLHCGDDHGIGA